MAITTNAIANSFKKQLLEATHNFSTSGSGGNTFKLAMYTNSATLGKSTTSYTTGNECRNIFSYKHSYYRLC